MQLKNKPAVFKDVEIIINAEDEAFVAYIDGPDKLRLDRYAEYHLASDSYIDNTGVTIEIQEDLEAKKKPLDYATLKQKIDDQNNPIPNSYILHANAQNNIGKLILVATYNNVEYTKVVEIIPLW